MAAATLYVMWQVYGRPSLARVPAGGVDPNTLFDASKIALGIVAGIGGVVALVVAYRRQRLMEDDHRREDAKLFIERFTKASEQLGSDKAAIRLAGVYAMASLADDWPRGRQTCIDVLCAYVRMPYSPVRSYEQYARSPRLGAKPERIEKDAQVAVSTEYVGEARYNPREERQVRDTVIRLIVDHLQQNAPVNWFGHTFDFTGATFEDLDFNAADFTGCYVDFRDCTFYGETHFSQARFNSCRVSFTGAIFAGRISFELAVFEDCEIDVLGDLVDESHITFYAATIISGEINVTTPRGEGYLSFLDVDMRGGTVSLFNLELSGDNRPAGLAISGSILSGGTFRILGGKFAKGKAYFNGLKVAGGKLIIGSDPEYGPTPEHGRKRFDTSLCGTEFSFDHVVLEKGSIDFIDVHFEGSHVHFNELLMLGGKIRFLGSIFKRGVIDFPHTVDLRGGVISFEETKEEDATLNLIGLKQDLRQPPIRGREEVSDA